LEFLFLLTDGGCWFHENHSRFPSQYRNRAAHSRFFCGAPPGD
jgi:hypothetical protein